MDIPPVPPNLPQRVSVADSAADRAAAHAFTEMLRLRYQALQNKLQQGQDLILEYHTPSGERITVTHVFHVLETDMMIFQGHGELGGWCEMLTRAPNIHMVFRIVARLEEAPERKPIGFHALNQQGELSEAE